MRPPMLQTMWMEDSQKVASAPNARYAEFFPDDQVLNFRRLVNRQLEIKNGDLLLPSGPGLGFEFDERAVKKYALDPREVWSECN